MRALLVINPKATTTSERGRDVLVRALRSQVRLTVAYTRRRGHAADLARRAVRQGVDVVVTLGGDGTVNEVVNGMLANQHDRPVPALAVVPGGSTNVFARALGLPNDSVEGTGAVIEALHEGRVRSIGLGLADERYFTFCAGYGLDAAVVRMVERARLHGKTATTGRYIRATMAQLLLAADRRSAPITLERPGVASRSGIASVIVQNTSPWTYLGQRQVNACPQASFDTGLDVMALRSLALPTTTRTVAAMLSRGQGPRGRTVLALHDQAEFTLQASWPVAFQLDGDYIGERTKISLLSVPDALNVFC